MIVGAVKEWLMGNRFVDKLHGFSPLAPREIAALLEITSHPKKFPAKADLIREGDRPGPVFVVLAVITFLATAACIAGRLCGRRSSSSSRGKSSSADAEKGLGQKHPHPVVAMRPLPSSRATVHDMVDDDVFEIKFAQVKPPEMGRDQRDGTGCGGGRVQALLPPLQLGLPRQYASPPGFRCAPANVAGVPRQASHPQVRGAEESRAVLR
jgi:hypothetical protein